MSKLSMVHLLIPVPQTNAANTDWLTHWARPKIACGAKFTFDRMCSTVVDHVTCKKCQMGKRYLVVKAQQEVRLFRPIPEALERQSR